MMVRKPVNQNRATVAQSTPYPASPASPNGVRTETPPYSEGFREGSPGTEEAQVRGAVDPQNNVNVWQSVNERATAQNGIPSMTARRGRKDVTSRRDEDIPPALRIGSRKSTPRSSWEGSRSTTPDMDVIPTPAQTPLQAAPIMVPENRQRSTSNNPYRQMHNNNGKAPERADFGGESSADIWDEDASVKKAGLGSQPTRHPFAEPWMKFETSPAEPAEPLSEKGPQIVDHGTAHDPAANSMTDHGDQRAAQAPMLDVKSPDTEANPHTFSEEFRRAPVKPSVDLAHNGIRPNEQPAAQVQNDIGEYSQAPLNETGEGSMRLQNDVAQEPWRSPSGIEKPSIYDSYSGDAGPPLPPRRSQEEEYPPPQPPRPPKTSEIEYGVTEAAPPMQSKEEDPAKKRRAGETYQIRLVNWYDASFSVNPRRSPIMVQNANGPCPLLALVNALVLSTPSGIETALVETLRVREQVSLGLLLDAVIDELMSGRRGSDLPDFTDLYAFLVNLHTGMNVNPRFVPLEAEALNLMDAPIDGDLPNNTHEHRQAGGFEHTREMKLYSTFTIPLIHGWLPPRNHLAFASLKRSAKTYEDAQNLMFREEELEEKLQRQGLGSGEQVVLEDIANVKYFLSSTATQLTGYGLDTMTETLAPGAIAILFRNDHFSTLYRHPRSGQLLTLVTDMGYAGHDEVVWESLVDVSGEGCEFFSGDFRPVGNVAGDAQQPALADDSGWATVGIRSRRPQRNGSANHSDLPPLSTLKITNNTNPLSPNTEQEDHDLALAMQLQEEEEERERQEAAKRRRDDDLSQAYLNNADSSGRRTFPGFGRGATGAQDGPSPPTRRSGSSRQAPGTNIPPPRKSSISEDAPPPTYEQAAKGPAYIPPATHPAHPNALPSPNVSTPRPLPGRPRGSSAYGEHAASYSGSPYYGNGRRGHNPRASTGRGNGGGLDPGMVRRRSGGPNSAISPEDDKKEKDCIVM